MDKSSTADTSTCDMCISCITFVAEDSSTPNQIGLYDMMPCSGGEVICRDARWTGSVRGENGVTRRFETPTDPTNDTTRTLKVPYFENRPSVTTNESATAGRWTSPTDVWEEAARTSWPNMPTMVGPAYHDPVERRMRNAGLHAWPLYVHTRCNGLLCADSGQAVANKFLEPTPMEDGEWPDWTGAPPRRAGDGPPPADEPYVGMHRSDEIRPHTLENSDFITGIAKKTDGTWPPAFLHPPHVPDLAPCKFTLLLSFDTNATTSLSTKLKNMGIIEQGGAEQTHPPGTRMDLQVGRLGTDVISIKETSAVVHEYRNHIAVNDLLANGGCRVVRETYHPSDWVRVLPSGTCLRMRPATEDDTGDEPPHGLACIDVGEYQPERVNSEGRSLVPRRRGRRLA